MRRSKNTVAAPPHHPRPHRPPPSSRLQHTWLAQAASPHPHDEQQLNPVIHPRIQRHHPRVRSHSSILLRILADEVILSAPRCNPRFLPYRRGARKDGMVAAKLLGGTVTPADEDLQEDLEVMWEVLDLGTTNSAKILAEVTGMKAAQQVSKGEEGRV
ncbi:hypothetical protein PISMIDRAFT_17781 [Pisolithus microcarpus 441]|uniref:Uncharacterized protein n=1 Tax=Pisolithus microcarpus 441 TaxID=765257 RepID=A0A0C9XMU6_9AGAM|nr:hypothetical protein BKA83DRAFT_17781 [Pisolithus microcarpus]KIK13735.1 hypothetical protein PISMIDRAFT_17781 [Pisolithus microcarpus 441]